MGIRSARALSTSRFFFGDDENELDQWFAGNSEGKTHPVGQKKPNAFGLYDMHGNVWQWVEDVYHDSYNGAPSDGSAWLEGAGSRVVRGGSWGGVPAVLRAACRSGDATGYRSFILGFRVARTLTP